MFRAISLALVCLGGISFQGFVSAQTAETPGWLEKDFRELTELFEGRWDNDRHVFFADDAGIDSETLAPRQHIEITRLAQEGSSGAVAEAILFRAVRTVEANELHSLIHTFSINATGQFILQTMRVESAASTASPIDCEVHWSRDGGQFRGEVRGEACPTLFPRPSEGGDLAVTMTLSPTDYWVIASRGEHQIEARFRRARPFECWTAILRGASHGDYGAGAQDWFFQRGVKLHDQGGVAVLTTDENPPRDIRLRLRDVDWTYGTNRPSLTLYVYEPGNDRAVSYAWGEAGAERIGINLRWLQASCTYTPTGGD